MTFRSELVRRLQPGQQKVALSTKRLLPFKNFTLFKIRVKGGREEKAGDSQEETECNYELMAIPLPCLSLLWIFLR